MWLHVPVPQAASACCCTEVGDVRHVQCASVDACFRPSLGVWAALQHTIVRDMLLPCSSTSLASTEGRWLLQGGDATAAGDQLTSWQGYQLAIASTAQNWAVDEFEAPEQARYVGAAPGHNRLVAGLVLHTTRKARSCRPGAMAGCVA
jgi:hypothetical protein